MNFISNKKTEWHCCAAKSFRIIRLSTLFLFIGISLTMATNMYSQSVALNLKMENATIEDVINSIEKQTEYHFLYNKKVVNVEKRVSVSAVGKPISEVLDNLFSNADISYTITDHQIVLNRKGAFNESQQTQTITGKVLDEIGDPVIGVNIVEKGTTNGTVTDIDGNFSINTPPSAVLVVSYIGYISQEIKIGSRTNIIIELKEDTQTLDEVVVVGYGTMRKKDLTGAVAQVRPDKLLKEGIASVQDLLRTGVPGLNVGVSSSAKGGGSLQVRGQRSLSANNDPLIVVDNVIFFGELSEINPQDIEQIDVLKDASSAAVFGAKSANGVIIVTTKKGKSEKPTVRFDANFGVTAMGRQRKVYDADGYLGFREDWFDSQTGFTNPGKYKQPTPENLAKYGLTLDEWRAFSVDQGTDDEIWLSRLGLFDKEKENYFAGRTYNWYDEAYRTGFRQDYNASISGRGDKVNYYFSLGYLDSKGQIVGDDYKSIRSNLKMDATVSNFLTLGANVNFQDRTDGNLAVTPGDVLQSNSPFSTPYEEDGSLAWHPMGENPLNMGYNYRFDRQFKELERGYTTLNTILTAKVKLPFNINYTLNFSPRFQWYHNRYHESSQHPEWKSKHNGAVDREQTQRFEWLVNNTINWDYTFAKKHKVNVTLAQEAEEHRRWNDKINARDFTPTDALGLHYVSGADKLKSSFSSEDTHSTGDALLARLFYSFDDKYMTTLSVRRDGYSAFGTSNPRATFMSAAFAWTFTEEDFFTWEPMSRGKLRGSWGSNGNRGVGIYDALSNLTSGTGSYAYIGSNGALDEISMLYVSRMANPNLRWERTTSWNFGLDFGFLNDRISGSIEYYHMPTTDLVMGQSLPSITGFSSITTNLGEVQNKGFEMTLNTLNIQRENFEWSSSLNLSLNRNKIVHLYYTFEDVLDENGNVIGRKEVDDQKNKWFIGHDINEIWNYQYEGIWQVGEEEEAAKYKQVPGDPKFKDIYDVENNRYSNEDKVFLGSTSPRFRWSFRNDFTFWKNFNVSVSIYSKWGQKGSEEFINSGYAAERQNVYELKYWTPDNPTNDYARLGGSNVASGGQRIIDKSFIRLESIALEYSIPKRFLSKYYISGLRLTGSVRNVACWTKEWQYNDPEYGSLVPVTFNFGLSLTL